MRCSRRSSRRSEIDNGSTIDAVRLLRSLPHGVGGGAPVLGCASRDRFPLTPAPSAAPWIAREPLARRGSSSGVSACIPIVWRRSLRRQPQHCPRLRCRGAAAQRGVRRRQRRECACGRSKGASGSGSSGFAGTSPARAAHDYHRPREDAAAAMPMTAAALGAERATIVFGRKAARPI